MVKIQPQVNFIKANMHGNMDAIAEEQSKLFKKEKYHPMASLIPLILQLVLLLGVVYIINRPLEFLFDLSGGTIDALAKFIGANPSESSYQLTIIDAIKNGTINEASQIAGLNADKLSRIISDVSGFKTSFLGLNLSVIPSIAWGVYILVPILAGASSWIMCHTQNMSNVIQHEQGKLNQYGIMILSVILSLYLGIFVPAGIALYWIASNLMSIAQMYILNWAINPKKYVNYEELESSRKALNEARNFGKLDKTSPMYKEMKKREKQDYKRFKHITNKHIVIYSERSGFYKYYKEIIEELLKKSNLSIHYVTNDYNDAIFELAKKEPRIKPYYISLKKTAILMMLVETDIFMMSTPDLNKYYLKRSFIKKDIEYIYIPHDTMSIHVGFNENAFDHFDTIFCTGEHIKEEIRKTEEVYGTNAKTLVEFGYPLLDNLIANVKSQDLKKEDKKKKQILIAPSWQDDNLLDSCIDELITNLYSDKNKLIVRPHPEYLKRYGFKMDAILEKYKDYDPEKLTFELDFSTNTSIYTSDVLITDWSGISAEFSFATERPCVFINTKMKVCNLNWEKIDITPVELVLRDKIGININKEDLGQISAKLDELFKDSKKYKKAISEYFETFTYNHGTAGEMGAKYILQSLMKKKQNKEKE